jgi:hypothetical protein
MADMSSFENTAARMIARNDSPQTSIDAAKVAPTGNMRKFVFALVVSAGDSGITNKEMTKMYPDIQASSITSRPNELEKKGLVFYRGDKRDGGRVIRVIGSEPEKLELPFT